MKNSKDKAPAKAQAEVIDSQVIRQFIEKEADWDAFWERVMKRATPQFDAYEKARVESLRSAPQHVFM